MQAVAFLVTSQSKEILGWVGNDGYDDNPDTHYSFDSKVANGKRIQLGSYLVLKRDGVIVGIGLVHSLEVKSGMKTLRKCPHCDRQALEKRKSDYRCVNCKLSCEESQIQRETIHVSEFRASYGNAWVESKNLTSGSQFEEVLDNHDIQSAVRVMSHESLEKALKLLRIEALPGLPDEFISA